MKINPNVLLLSNVLMYLDEPYSMFKRMLSKEFEYVIIDTNAFFSDADEKARFMLQNVPPSIYKAVVPAYIFGLNDFRLFIDEAGYSIIWEWICGDRTMPIAPAFPEKRTLVKGFLLKKKLKG